MTLEFDGPNDNSTAVEKLSNFRAIGKVQWQIWGFTFRGALATDAMLTSCPNLQL